MTLTKGFRFSAERANFGRVVRLWASRLNERDMLEIIKPVLLETRDTDLVDEPFLELRGEDAQQLYDALHAAGFRPVDNPGSAAGELAATRAHLNDMRVLVSKSAEVELGAK